MTPTPPPAPAEAAMRAITPESQPVFPCWLYVRYRPLSGGVPSWEYAPSAPDMTAWNVTHWHPDQRTAPTVPPAHGEHQGKQEATGKATPRTDGCELEVIHPIHGEKIKVVRSELARTLERELADMKDKMMEYKSGYQLQSARLAEVERELAAVQKRKIDACIAFTEASDRALAAEQKLKEAQEELSMVLSDWNAIVKASGAKTNGTAIAHVASLRAEIERLVKENHNEINCRVANQDAVRACNREIAELRVQLQSLTSTNPSS
jgi:hypothetical protein